ncbi:hypothetical protein G4V62_04640 [Bacillaceae bacterium SIJ1]|uniref:hypothetical protein n=1 Tax=Litoribacterium kuwaitense TaxID=1398745 RepID=UPI0013EDBA3F|nr:hypothetical protein [Litoribacterium kuwaitense]NGP44274.1 hypothetical protein [Litoribacterium kuwaitense]
MEEKKAFHDLLKEIEKRLWLRHSVHFVQWALGLLAGMFFLSAVVYRIFPDWPWTWLWLIGTVVVFFVVGWFSWKRRPHRKQAARVYDGETSDRPVTTAVDYLEDDAFIAVLQRREAIRSMKQVKPQVLQKARPRFDWRPLTMLFVSTIGTALSFYFPSDGMREAALASDHQRLAAAAKEQVSTLEEELPDERLKEALERLNERIGKEQTAKETLSDVMEAEKELNALREEQEQLAEEAKKQQQDLAEAGLSELVDKAKQQQVNELTKELQSLQDAFSELTDAQKAQLAQMANEAANDAFASLSEDQLKAIAEQLAEQMASLQLAKQVGQLQADVQALAQSLSQQMAAAGLEGAESLAFSGDPTPSSSVDPSQGTGDGDSQGSNGTSGGQSGSSGEGGEGSGSGSGSGQGSGSGGSGAGSGAGQGSGQGAGQGTTEIGELTFPERLDGPSQTEVDTGELGEGGSEVQQTPGAPATKGSVRPYEEMYETYEQVYRDSMNRQALPPQLEEAVKGYFSEIRPEGDE